MEMDNLLTIFRNEFQEANLEFTPETNFRALGDWDSLTAMVILMEIEEGSGIRISEQDFKKCVTIKDVYDYINN